MPALNRCRDHKQRRPQKITFGEMRDTGVRGVLVYRADYHCSHSIAISGDRWPDDVSLSDLEPRFTCQACGTKRGSRSGAANLGGFPPAGLRSLAGSN